MEKQETLSTKNRELETEVARNREDLVVRNKELRFQVFSLETLMGLTHQLNSSLDLEALLGTMILSVVGQLRVNSACLFLTDQREDPKRLDAWTFKGVKEDLVRSIHFLYEDEFIRAILPTEGEEGRPVRLQDLSEDPSLERSVGPLYAAGFALVCPVMMKQKLTAILAVGEKVSGQDFQSTDLEMVKALSESAGIAIENARLFKDLQDTYLATVRVLVSTIEAKDPYTHGHTERVAQYAVGIAKAMEFSQDEIQTIQLGAFLHDIGKLHTSDSILHKPGALTEEEWRLVKAHPVRGAQMLQGVKFLEKATDLVRHHHERVDGKGYPDGLRGDEITVGAKIVNVADAFDAMTTERPYRAGLSMDQAIAQLEEKAGTQFAAEIVEVMVRSLREGRIGVIKNEAAWSNKANVASP
jgi:putative nucleotidyltransferase with HDIG domain